MRYDLRTVIRTRTFRLAMLAFTTLWFGVVLPGHERGVLTVPGSATTNDCASCPENTHCSTESSSPTDTSPGSDDPSSHCAICKFIGTLDLPVLVDFAAPISLRVALLNWASPTALCVVEAVSRKTGRAPPFIA